MRYEIYVVILLGFIYIRFNYYSFSGWVLLDSDKVKIAGGIMGVINTFAGWFEAFAGVANTHNSYLVPKEIPLPDLSLWFKRKKSENQPSE